MRTILLLLVSLLAFTPCFSQDVQIDEPKRLEIEYARIGDRRLTLDLYQPAKPIGAVTPTVIWIHGGAWRSGSKQDVPVLHWLNLGYAIASVEYRLSPEAKFPAQVHDIKAAIRFLRANAEKYRLDAERLVIAGASAGGHLAALVGVSDKVDELEGSVGDHLQVSSRVQAIVSFYGAANLQTILSQSTEHGLSVRVPALQLLLGGQPEEVPKQARLASPVAHVDANDPPLWLVHGDEDPQMPIAQSEELREAYVSVNRPVEWDVVSGGKHGGEPFYQPERLERLANAVTRSLAASGRAADSASRALQHRDLQPIRMLFAGSSSTYWNDMPNEIAKCISKQGGLVKQNPVTAELVGRSGSDIRVYLDPQCDYQYGVRKGQSFLDKVQEEKFDYVVLMTVSRFIMGDGDGNPDGQAHRDAITTYCNAIRQAGSEPVFYEMGWGMTPRDSEGRQRIMELARQNQIRVFVPCATAWARVSEERPALKLQHENDKSHPGDLGHFLNLACFYAAFVQRSPEGHLPRQFHVWPHLTKAEQQKLKPQLDAANAIFKPDAYQAKLPEWMRRHAGSGFIGRISEDEAKYLERVAWETYLKTNAALQLPATR